MQLNDKGIMQPKFWEEANIHLPGYDRKKMIVQTHSYPTWVHFGAGNIFRAFPAVLQEKLLNAGEAETGIIVVEGYDYEIIDQLFVPHDNLSLLVTLKANGTIEKTVVGSIAEALRGDSKNEQEFTRLKEIFRSSSLQMASFTITEKGYSLVNSQEEFLADVSRDFLTGPAAPESYMGKVAALCYERYCAGALPLALVSMDNCSHNGTRLQEAILSFARRWQDHGKVEAGFIDYLADSSKVSFPWSMIDKITPRPDDGVKEMLKQSGLEEVDEKVTGKNTHIAPFVNAEEAEYLVIEDLFPAGRPALEKVGVIFTTRETVDKVEKMKVCTCLNPLHTSLAIFGCLLDYQKISEEMKDPELVELIKQIGYVEGLPVVTDPGILSPRKFLDEVIEVRLPNPFMPDTPQRIATDTSQKLSIRFGETIKTYEVSDHLKATDLKFIPLVFAGWIRYLLGVDDRGNAFTVSPDPMYQKLFSYLSPLRVGEVENYHQALQPILSNSVIFGVDLYQVGLGEIVESYFKEMMTDFGAVRRTLQKYLSQ